MAEAGLFVSELLHPKQLQEAMGTTVQEGQKVRGGGSCYQGDSSQHFSVAEYLC